jgi:hypothetical protein
VNAAAMETNIKALDARMVVKEVHRLLISFHQIARFQSI